MVIRLVKEPGGEFTIIMQQRRLGYPRLRINTGVAEKDLRTVVGERVGEMRRPKQPKL